MTERHEVSLGLEQVAKLDTSQGRQQNGLKTIARNFQRAQVITEPEILQVVANESFQVIKRDLPDADKPIYWLGRAFPETTPLAISYLQRSISTVDQAQRIPERIRDLKQRAWERENPVEYQKPEDQIFVLDEEDKRKIHNAIRYNDLNLELYVAYEAQLPEIPGKVTLGLQQAGNKWGVKMYLENTQVDTSKKKSEYDEFGHTFGFMMGEDPALGEFATNLSHDSQMSHAIGKLQFTSQTYNRPAQNRKINSELQTFTETIGDVLGNEYRAAFLTSGEEASAPSVILQNVETNDTYGIKVVTFGSTAIDGLSIARQKESHMHTITEDPQKFQQNLESELKFANGIVSWIYQHARAETEYRIPINSPDQKMLDGMKRYNIFFEMHKSPNKFEDLGGHYELRRQVERDTDNFIRVFSGETGILKPQNTIFYGETGAGKTSLENAVAAKLIDAGVPVFVLRGDMFHQALQNDPAAKVSNLKEMFYFQLIQGGAILVRDFDALLGTRDNQDVDPDVQRVLMSELQRIKEEPTTWFLADTEFFGLIPDNLVNAHRIGKHREVPVETDEGGVDHITSAILRKIDKERSQRLDELSLVNIEAVYPFDRRAFVSKIVSEKVGGIVPAQIERILREELDENEAPDTDSLLRRIDNYVLEKEQETRLRELQRAQAGPDAVIYTRKLAQETADRLDDFQKGVEGELQEIKKDVSILQRDVSGVIGDTWTHQRISGVEGRVTELEGKVKEETIPQRYDRMAD